MQSTRETLLEERAQLMRELERLGDFRRGTVSTNYRKCGKASCHCMHEGDPGHGPQQLWNATIRGKSYARHLKTAAQLQQYKAETSRYREFVAWCDRFIALNEQLCDMHASTEEHEVEQAKKKLRKRSAKNSKGK